MRRPAGRPGPGREPVEARGQGGPAGARLPGLPAGRRLDRGPGPLPGVRRLGEVECRDCGHVREPATTRAEADDVPGLAEEVEMALARVLGRAGRPARIG